MPVVFPPRAGRPGLTRPFDHCFAAFWWNVKGGARSWAPCNRSPTGAIVSR